MGHHIRVTHGATTVQVALTPAGEAGTMLLFHQERHR